MAKGLILLVIGWALALGGGYLAHRIQTTEGVEVHNVRFSGEDGLTLSGLLYLPADASAQDKAPAVLASHGYINTREMQSPFAIELSRRGFVVLAMDMTGHGGSGGNVGAQGFGGPAGLAYLRSLPMVDPGNVGLTGHSLGGAPMLFAARSAPQGYRSVALVGSTPGIFGSPEAEGDDFPRNLAVVFGAYDEFAELMWQVERGADAPRSERLMAIFETLQPVEPGRLYGDPAAGSARILHLPAITHPWEHFSSAGVAPVVAWFQQTLDGEARPLDPADQIWIWKEVGTLAGFIGLVVVILGAFQLATWLPLLSALVQPAQPADGRAHGRWWGAFALAAFVPAITYYPLMELGQLFPPSAVFPQYIHNQLLVWALGTAIATLLAGLMLKGPKPDLATPWLGSLILAVVSVGAGYLTLVVVEALFTADFRFWVLGLRTLDGSRFLAALAYLPLWIAFFLILHRTLAARLALRVQTPAGRAATFALALSLGFVLLLAAQYASLFATGRLLTPEEPLNTIVAIQFVPLLMIVGVIGAVTYTRTNAYAPGAFICALLLSWYVASGTANHWAPGFEAPRPAAPAKG